jgi:hypothetical protein
VRALASCRLHRQRREPPRSPARLASTRRTSPSRPATGHRERLFHALRQRGRSHRAARKGGA